jgi:ABC-2 type transport system permease protein
VTLLRLALRLGRVGAIAAGVIGVAAAVAQPLAFAQLAGDTPAERAVFAQQMELLARQLTYLLPLPHALGTMPGWIEWRAIGALEVIVGFWAVMAASGAGRGDEERGLVEHWLAQGVSRGRYIASRIVAFAILGTVVVTLTLLAAGVGSALGKEPVPPLPLALQGIALLGLLLCCYAISLLAAQLVTTRRGGVALGGGALLVLYLIDVVARSDGADSIRWISPFWLYDQNHPLTNGGTLDVPKTLALYITAVVFTAAASVGFVRRDLGAPLLRRPRRDTKPTTLPAGDPFLRVPVLAILDQQRTSLVAWALVLAALGVFFLSFTRTLVDTMLATPTFRLYMERAGLGTYTAFIGLVWFSALVLLLSLYAIVQANGWAADDQEGRLEIVAAQPVSRARIVVERLVALLTGAAVIVTVSGLALSVGASAADIAIDDGRLALGSVLALGVVFAFGGLGAAGVSWRPRATTIVLGAVAMLSYLVQELAPLFAWPPWVADLSLYALYGNPVSGNVDWARSAALFGIGVVGSLVAVAAMRRRDIGR